MGCLSGGLAVSLAAQTSTEAYVDEDVYILSPFEVSAGETMGYVATTSLAGTRIKTELRDVGSAISVVTAEFMKDTGATDNESLLIYTANTEVGGVLGNFSGATIGAMTDESANFARPSTNTRVRGLAAADNTRDFFVTEIPWDSYVIDRVDLQRGPNAILFGIGSPAGIINTSTKTAGFETRGELELRYGRYDSMRASINYNQAVIEDELGVFVAGLIDNKNYRQKPAFEDVERVYGAFRWEPKALKKAGTFVSLKGNFENGDITRNNPRTITPMDYITPWFRPVNDPMGGLGKEGYDPWTLQDDMTGTPGHGGMRPTINGGDLAGQPNPYFRPWLGNFAQQFASPMWIFGDEHSKTANDIRTLESIGSTGAGALTSTGAYANGSNSLAYHRPASVTGFSNYAQGAQLPDYEFGTYKNFHLSDRTIFDFYNNLLDGPNKETTNEFQAYNLNLSGTFMDNLFGIEFVFDKQDFEDTSLSLVQGQHQGIYIDVNETYSDHTLNPNFGRPFISDASRFGNSSNKVERESTRVTAFADFDLPKLLKSDSLWTRIVGRHTITGLYSIDKRDDDQRQFMRYGTGDTWANYISTDYHTEKLKMTANERLANYVMYLGPSLAELSSASGAHIPRPQSKMSLTDGQIHTFEYTWTADGVNPGDPYTNILGQDDVFQNANPSNYVGYTRVPIDVLDATRQPDRDLMTTDARKTRQEVTSEAVVWQAYMFDRSIVGTVGWRKDTVEAWNKKAGIDSTTDRVILHENYDYSEEPNTDVSSESTSYSVAWHITDSIRKWVDSPVKLSMYYNTSENFDPGQASRVSLLGNSLAMPSGKTEDKSLVISTLDDRYSLKVTRYYNKVTNSSSSMVGGDWFIGGLQEWGATWANIFEYSLGGSTMDTQFTGNEGRYTYGPATGETEEQAIARMHRAVAGWRAHQQRIRTELPGFYDIWLRQGDPLGQVVPFNWQAPQGFALTEDSVSKGWELELTANPTANWRISVNATQVEAVRRNVGGAEMIQFMDIVTDDLNNTAAGDLRIWWGGAGNDTTLLLWNRTIGANWSLIQLKEGTDADEIREWRFNVVSNYTFTDGRLKGFNVGGSYRWEDDIVIGYPLMTGDDGKTTYDLSNPYKGPSESSVDLWVGYGRKLTDKVDWRIQLNVRNAFGDDELIPLSTQPDGTPAALRIPPNRVWTLTNTFSF